MVVREQFHQIAYPIEIKLCERTHYPSIQAWRTFAHILLTPGHFNVCNLWSRFHRFVVKRLTFRIFNAYSSLHAFVKPIFSLIEGHRTHAAVSDCSSCICRSLNIYLHNTLACIPHRVGCRDNVVQNNMILHTSFRWVGQNIYPSLNSQTTPHTSP